MPTNLEEEILYLSHVGGGSALAGKASLGFFAITDTHVVYVPTHTQEIATTNTLAGEQTLKTNDCREYDGMKFWDVVPTKAQSMSAAELSEYIATMCDEVEGSCRVERDSVRNIKAGALKVVVDAGDESFSVNLGIAPSKKKQLRKFLLKHPFGGATIAGRGIEIATAKLPEPEVMPAPAGRSVKVKQLAFAACTFLVLAVGIASFDYQEPRAPSTSNDVYKHLDISNMLTQKAERASDRKTKLLREAKALKQKANVVFAEIKAGMEAGESRAQLRELARNVRSIEAEEKRVRQQACFANVQAERYVLQANTELVEAHSRLVQAASSESARQDSMRKLEAARRVVTNLSAKSNVDPREICS